MYLIFNKDGSTKETLFNEYINKGSDGVNFIDVAVVGYGPGQYTASGTFTPKSQEAMVASPMKNVSITTSSGTYLGYRFYLYAAFTQYPGDLAFSLTCHLGSATLVTYSTTLTVNDSATTSKTTITWEQYENLMNTIKNYQLQYSCTNVRGYGDDIATLKNDLDNIATYQIVLYNPERGNLNSLKLGIKGADELLDIPLDVSSDYVTKNASFVTASTVQEVPSGLKSVYTGKNADGNQRYVSYGTNASTGAFEAQATYGISADTAVPSSNAPTIFFHSTRYEFRNVLDINVFEDNGQAVYLRSYNGTVSLALENGSATLTANTFNYGDYLAFTNGGQSAIYKGEANFEGNVSFAKLPKYTGMYGSLDNNDFITLVYANKLDDNVKAYAMGLMNESHDDLQEQIDAINESQNFVATYATKADMPTPPVSALEEKDCVLVLKDESHDDQAYVYKYNSAGWVEVGPLGDYYTTAQIDKQHNAIEAKITTLGARVDSIAKISWRQW
jgi:hypothetical protein